MHWIEQRFLGYTLAYAHSIAPLGGAESLLARLEDAHKYRKEKFKDLES